MQRKLPVFSLVNRTISFTAHMSDFLNPASESVIVIWQKFNVRQVLPENGQQHFRGDKVPGCKLNRCSTLAGNDKFSSIAIEFQTL